MRSLFTALFLAAFALLTGCESAASSTACSIDDAPPLDAKGKANGIYGVLDGKLGAAPLAPFDAITISGTGVDAPTGKRWVGVHLRDAEAKAVHEFTSGPAPRGIAVVVGGSVASAHKVREALTGPDAQVSCCDPAACDRWLEVLGAPAKPR